MIFTKIVSGMFRGVIVREFFGNSVSVILRNRLRINEERKQKDKP